MNVIKNLFNNTDMELIAELQQQLPDKIFDVDCHIYRREDLGAQPEIYELVPLLSDIDTWHEIMSTIIGRDRLMGGMYLTPPTEKEEQLYPANEFLLSELSKDDERCGVIMFSPLMGPERVEAYIKTGQVVGIKPFCTYGNYQPDYEAPLSAFLPEWAWQIADKYGILILIHLMKYKALNDPENYGELASMCAKYPNARVMLDHGGRGFNMYNTIKGLKNLQGLDNVYVDTSCICESGVSIAVINTLGISKLVFGLDYPLALVRGRAITVGDGFVWLKADNFKWKTYDYVCSPSLLGIESIRALIHTISVLKLTEKEKSMIFYENAVQMIRKANNFSNNSKVNQEV